MMHRHLSNSKFADWFLSRASRKLKITAPAFLINHMNEQAGRDSSLVRNFRTLVYESRINSQRTVQYLSAAARQRARLDTRPGTVLIVHNRPEVINLINVVLTANGHRVLWTDSPEEGLRLIESCQPDVVIHNIMLNTMGPQEFDRQIRERWSKERVAVMIVSSYYVTPEYMDTYGISTYMPAPFDPTELPELVAGAMDSRDTDGSTLKN